MAYGDRVASADVGTHVEACATCRAQAGSYVDVQATLRRNLYRFECPDAHTLGEYQLDLLEPERRQRVAAHSVECDACSAELQTLRSYLTMPTSVPESIAERARRMVATLFQPASGLAYGGLRGTSAATTRVFQVEDVTITVGPGQGTGTLVGLVLISGVDPQALDGRPVRLLPSDSAPLSSAMDELGNFEFEGLPADTYALEIELPDALLVVEELRLD